MARYYGVGRTFKRGPGGIPARVEDKDLIRDSLFQAFSTYRGERVMRPDFGSTIRDFVFESQGAVLDSMVRRETSRVFSQFEPRAKLIDVYTRQEDTLIVVEVTYSIDGREPERLSVPVPES